MPEGTGGQVCTDIHEVKIFLKREPNFVFQVSALDAIVPARISLSFKQLNEPGKWMALATVLAASSSGKVAVEWRPPKPNAK